LVITNRGSQTITGVNCFAGNGTNITLVATPSLVAGGSNSGIWTRSTETSVICSGKCLTIGVTGECKLGQSCWK
jgi:hypothetical protein